MAKGKSSRSKPAAPGVARSRARDTGDQPIAAADRLILPPPERKARRDRALLLKLTAEEGALVSRVAKTRGEPLATTARLLLVAAARANLGEG